MNAKTTRISPAIQATLKRVGFAVLVLGEVVHAQPYEPIVLYEAFGEPGEQLGASVLRHVGDQDGDGYDDILVSVADSTHSSGTIRYNHLRLIYGNDFPPYRTLDFAHTLTDTTTEWTYWAGASGYGPPLEIVDLSGDGCPDILIELHFRESILYQRYLFLGGPGVFDTLWDWRSDNAEPRKVLETLPHFNDNGIGCYLRGGVAAEQRLLEFYQGQWPDPPSSSTWTHSVAWNWNFFYPNGVGDITGDGYTDFLYSLRWGDGTYHVHGWFGGPDADSIPDVTFIEDTMAVLSTAWSIIGDMNGDSVDDLAAHTIDHHGVQLRVWYGGQPQDFNTWDATLNGGGGLVPYAHACLGDINGDGYEDMAFTDAPVHRVCVYLGADHVDSDIAYQVNFPNEDGNVLGDYSRSGDINGDGLDDWMYSSFYGDTLQRGYIRIISGDPRFGLPVGDEPPPVVREFVVGDPYPNPFNSSVTIPIEVIGSPAAEAKVAIFDLLGRQVFAFQDRKLTLGHHDLVWHGETTTGASVATGVYFVAVQTTNLSVVKKLVYLR
ncbi:T9SS type A sorting domain-containing protein [bacterium]|nr:T9SS type A sorting domain-containing protein [bacterium]